MLRRLMYRARAARVINHLSQSRATVLSRELDVSNGDVTSACDGWVSAHAAPADIARRNF